MPSPTKEQFIEGLRNVLFAKNQKEILRCHYCAPDHTRTANQLAKEVNYQGYPGVNANYGTFGHNLARAMVPPVSDEDATNWKFMLKHSLPYLGPDGEMALVMCDELVNALDELCWSWCREEGESPRPMSPVEER
jgi:hypothetical protein